MMLRQIKLENQKVTDVKESEMDGDKSPSFDLEDIEKKRSYRIASKKFRHHTMWIRLGRQVVIISFFLARREKRMGGMGHYYGRQATFDV